MAQACNEYQSLAEETFHMARKSIGMAAPSPASRSKRVVTQGSPHAKKIAKYAADPEYVNPNECFTPQPRQMQHGQMRSTPGPIRYATQHYTPAGSPRTPQSTPGSPIPTRGTPFSPSPRHPQAQAQLKPTLKPMSVMIDHKKKRPVWLMRKVVRITYPADQPTAGFAALPRAQTPLKSKQSPGKKPWEWPNEEKFPGTVSQSQKIIKDVKYKLQQVQRKLGERGKGAVRSREPRLAAEKRWDMHNMDMDYIPYPGDTARKAALGSADRELRARRQEYAQQCKRQLQFRPCTPTLTRKLHAMYGKHVAPRETQARRFPQGSPQRSRSSPSSAQSSPCSVYYDAVTGSPGMTRSGSPGMTRSSAGAYTPITDEQAKERMQHIKPDDPVSENDWAIVDAFVPVIIETTKEYLRRIEAVKTGNCEDYEKIKNDIKVEVFNTDDFADHLIQYIYATSPYLNSETNEKLIEERAASAKQISNLADKAEEDLKRRLCPQYFRHEEKDDD